MADLTVDDLRSALKEQSNTFLSGIAKAMQGKDPKSSNSSGGSSGSGSLISGTYKDLGTFQKAVKDAESTLNNLGRGGKELTGMAYTVKSTTSSVLGFAGEMRKTEGGFAKLGLGLGTGITLFTSLGAAIAGFMHDSLKTYQDTRDIGQNFNGSILGMHLAAAQARMPLDQFAAALKKNATTVAIVGQQGFGKLSVSLRNSLMDVGQLGMTTDQLNDVVGNYMNTMMMFGKLQTTSTQQATMSMRNLAIEASALAQASGKSRAQLMEDTNKAMDLATLRAVAMDKQGQAGVQFTENMTKATMFMASLPGEAGKTLSTMLAETVGNGSALLTSSMTDFTKAGMYGVGNMMESMSAKIKSGKEIDPSEMASFYQEFMKEGKDSYETLKFQAAAGNEQAKKMLAMYEDMSAHASQYTEAELKKAYENQKHQESITKAMTNFEAVFNNITGAIKEQFFQAIMDFTNSDSFKKLEVDMNNLKDSLKALWGKVFTPENIATASTIMVSTFKILAWVGDKIASVANVMLTAFNALASKVGGVTAVLGVLGTALAARWLYKKAKKEIADSKARVAAMEGTRDGFTAAIRPLVMSSALRVIDASTGKANGAIDALEEAEHGKGGGSPKKGGRFRRGLGNANNAFNKHGTAGLVLASAAVDGLIPDGTKGKATASAALQGATIGSSIGEVAGPMILSALAPITGGLSLALIPFAPAIGAALGAGVGVVTENWDAIKDTAVKGFDWIVNKFEGMFSWFGQIFTMANMKKVFDSSISYVSDVATKGFDFIKDKLSGFIMFIPNLINNIADWFSSKFSWLKDFDAMSTFKTMLSYMPGGPLLVKAFDALTGDKSVGGAAGGATTSVPTVELENLKKRVDDLQKQLTQQQKDNQTLHKLLDKLNATVEHGNASNAAHQKAQIAETKKSTSAVTSSLNGV